MKKTIRYSEWAAVFAQLSASRADVVPAGWLRSDQLAAEQNCSLRKAQRKAKAAVAAGLAQVRIYHVPTGRKIYPIPHYRLTARKIA